MAQGYVSPTGVAIVGTADSVLCCAAIVGIEDNGTPIWGGGTKVDWDSQRTRTRDGKILFGDENGNEWTFDQLTKADEDEEPEPAKSHTLTNTQRDMILAALRLWQGVVNDGGSYLTPELLEVATNSDEHELLDDVGIDQLCEALNT